MEIISQKGYTCYSVEKALGFGNGAIKRWATNSPSINKLYELSNFLGISINFLLANETEKTSDCLALPADLTGEGDLTPISVTPADMTEELLLEEYRAADKQKRKAILQAALGTNHEPKGETL
jgi:transcriptional regulator with XRE-family HTH domain